MLFINRRAAMLALGLVSLAIYFVIVNISALRPLKYALDQFYVLWHEGGHSLAAILTGGSISELVILPGIGGYAAIAGGNFAISLPLGYLGAAIVGSVMFFVTNTSPKWSDLWAFVYGSVILFVGLVFYSNDALTRVVNVGIAGSLIFLSLLIKKHRTIFTAIFLTIALTLSVLISGVERESSVNLAVYVALITGGLLVVLGSSGRTTISLIILNVYNLALVINAWLRVTGLPEITHIGGRDDASQYANLFGGDPKEIATRWLVASLMLFIISLVFTYRKLGQRTNI